MLWAACADLASAQTATTRVVSNCGTPGVTLNAGTPWFQTIDTNGNLCGSVSIGAGSAAIGYVGGFDVIVSSTPTVQNAAYSASNAIGGWQQVSVFRNTTQPSGVLDYNERGEQGGIDHGIDDLWIYQVQCKSVVYVYGQERFFIGGG